MFRWVQRFTPLLADAADHCGGAVLFVGANVYLASQWSGRLVPASPRLRFPVRISRTINQHKKDAVKAGQRVLAGLAVVATLGAASGCGASGEPSSPAGPQQVLLDSVEALTAGGNFAFTVTGRSIGITGTVDVPSKSAYVAVETRGQPAGWPAFHLRTVDRERWIRVDIQPGVPTPSADAATGSYVRIDPK